MSVSVRTWLVCAKGSGGRAQRPALLKWEREGPSAGRCRAGTAQTQFPFLRPVSAAALLRSGMPYSPISNSLAFKDSFESSKSSPDSFRLPRPRLQAGREKGDCLLCCPPARPRPISGFYPGCGGRRRCHCAPPTAANRGAGKGGQCSEGSGSRPGKREGTERRGGGRSRGARRGGGTEVEGRGEREREGTPRRGGGEPRGRRRGLGGLPAGERRLPARLSQETAAGLPREGKSKSLPGPAGQRQSSRAVHRIRRSPRSPARRSGMSEEPRYPGP